MEIVNEVICADEGDAREEGGETLKADRPLIPYYGGKFGQRTWLCPLLESIPHDVYVAPFGGAAGDILGRSSPAKVECWNDLDGGLANLFRTLRDPARAEQLCARLEYTEYSQSVVQEAVKILKRGDAGEFMGKLADVEWAWAVYVRGWLGFAGIQARNMQYGYVCSLATSRCYGPTRFIGARAALPAIVRRLQHVQVFNEDWRQFVRRFEDSPDALIYCDPPYPRDVRRSFGDYRHEGTEELYADLAEWAGVPSQRGQLELEIAAPQSVASATTQPVVISSYAGEWAESLREQGWMQLEHPSSVGSGRFKGAQRQMEVVLLNEAAVARMQGPSQLSLV